MAYTLIGGTAIGTLLTLTVLPAMYSIWYRIADPRKNPPTEKGSSLCKEQSRNPASNNPDSELAQSGSDNPEVVQKQVTPGSIR